MIGRRSKTRGGVIAALDIGSSKVCCFVARMSGDTINVIGIGHQVAKGLRGGSVVDMEAAEAAILNAVSAAEQMAGETLRSVIVSLSAGQLASHTTAVDVEIAGHEVGDTDLRRVIDHGRQHNQRPERELIHAIPVAYTIDGSRGIRDPRGMFGTRLGVNMHMITAAPAALRNLATCIGRCHLSVDGFVVSPYAAGLAVLVEDEMDLGATVIDMGGGTTSIAVFFDGNVIHVDGVPVGGNHITNDIARGLSTPVAHAERMKTLYGSAIASPADEREVIDVPLVGEEDGTQPNHIPKSILVGIIRPRLEEIFEMVRARLEASGVDKIAGRRVVLTGGGSQLQGVRELAGLILDKQVRLGRPIRVAGLADSTGGPAFAVCAGLLQYPLQRHAEAARQAAYRDGDRGGLFGRFGLWLREVF